MPPKRQKVSRVSVNQVLVFEDCEVSENDATVGANVNVLHVDVGSLPGVSSPRPSRRTQKRSRGNGKKVIEVADDDMPDLTGESDDSDDSSEDEEDENKQTTGTPRAQTSSARAPVRSKSSSESASRRPTPISAAKSASRSALARSAPSTSGSVNVEPRSARSTSSSESRSGSAHRSAHSTSSLNSKQRSRPSADTSDPEDMPDLAPENAFSSSDDDDDYDPDSDVEMPGLYSSADDDADDHDSDEEKKTNTTPQTSSARARSASSSSSLRSPNSSPSDASISNNAHSIVVRDGVLNCSVVSPSGRSKLDPATTPIARHKHSSPTEWTVNPRDTAGFVHLSHSTFTEINVVVRENRVNKAMEKLHPEALQSALISRTNCTCGRNCNNKFTFGEVLQMRCVLFGDSSLASEQDVTEKAVKVLRSFNEDLDPEKRLTYFGHTARSTTNDRVPVCPRYWACLYGLCESKMKKVRSMVKSKSTIAVHGRTNATSPKQVAKKVQCHAFWTHFFNENCQKPTDSIRLFPVNKPFRLIYEQYFTPWFQKLNQATEAHDDEFAWMPSFTVFCKARKHPDFKDVKHRPRHYHARCRDCDELNAIRLRGFVNDEQKLAFDIAFKAHQAEARSWHEHEESMKMESRRNGGRNSVVIGYDDTSALELPKFTNRDVKNLTKSRLHVIPFNLTNYTSGETAYVYTLKGRYPKGANRLCTVLYHYLHKLKHGTHPSRFARKLYLHADNYAENKNNVLFTFATHLVMLGWYDEVYLEYGPPGHTHNGTDAVHRIHNQVAGNFTSLTLGQFQQTWTQSWRKDFSMPAAVINDAHLDFANYYQPYMQEISGHTRTLNDPRSVKAFKFQWSRKITAVEMLWKQCADDTDRWLGTDGKVESQGFFMLKMLPPGRPSVIPPMKKLMLKQWINEMTGPAMLRQCKAHVALESQATESIAWLKKCANTCQIPYELVDREVKSDNDEDDESTVTQSLPISGWGPRVKVGIPSIQGDFFLMTDKTLPADENKFWKLPDDLAAIVDADILAALDARRELEGLPNVRYKNRRSGAPNNSRLRYKHFQSMVSDDEDVDDVQHIDLGSPPSPAHVENSIEEKHSEAQPDDYGADFNDCKKGHIAVVLTTFEEGSRLGTGLEFYSIDSVHPHTSEDEEDYFLPRNAFAPVSPGVYVTQEACLNSKWRTVLYNRSNLELFRTTKILGWQVLYYFKAFNKKGRGLLCLSEKNREAILQCGRTHNVVLFYEEPAREHPRALQINENDGPYSRRITHESDQDESDEPEEEA
jgi:hypothetical protein